MIISAVAFQGRYFNTNMEGKLGMDYQQIYQEFQQVKHLQEYSEYVSELDKINRLLYSSPFDSCQASKLCSDLAGKYEAEINQQPAQSGVKRTVIRGQNLPQKTDAELMSDLQYYQTYIPYFALKREVKSELKKALLGL